MVKFATVGAGWIVDSFIEAAKTWEPDLIHTAVYSFRREEAESFARKHQVENIFIDLDELGKSEVDMIYIANPNALHYSTSRKLLGYGKHVLCEKTSVVTSEQLKELYRIADEKEVIFLEAMKTLYMPQMDLIKEAMKKLGKIHMAKFDFCRFSSKYPAFLNGESPNIFNPALAAGGLMDMGIYSVYPAIELFGEPEKINAQAVFMSTRADLAGTALFEYKDCHVSISWSKGSTSGHDTTIHGSSGVLHIENMEHIGNVYIEYPNGTREDIIVWEDSELAMKYEAKKMVDLITNYGSNEIFYKKFRACTARVIQAMEVIRKEAGILFPEDCYRV